MRPRFLTTAVFIFMLLSAGLAQEDEQSIEIRFSPETVYAEQTEIGQYISFDFQVINHTEQKLRLIAIHLKAFDEQDQLMYWKKLDSNGFRPSIETIGVDEVEPNSSLYVFNPFFFFDTGIKIKGLMYEFRFAVPGQQGIKRVPTEVTPVYYEPNTDLVLPVKAKRLWVYDGPDFYSHHRRIDPTHPFNRDVMGMEGNGQRYALDLTVIAENGMPFTGSPSKKENWYGFGVPVTAPAKGKIIALENDRPDDIPFDMKVAREDPLVMLGNYVIIDHRNGEYSMMAHFKEGTITVELGEEVKQGDLIGQMGRSGMGVGLVHVHYELRTSGDLLKAEGLPTYFRDFRRIIGAKKIAMTKGRIDSGHIVESVE
ncbi:MAG: M23 family metallopeptidase [Acidobacteriota bacterium]